MILNCVTHYLAVSHTQHTTHRLPVAALSLSARCCLFSPLRQLISLVLPSLTPGCNCSGLDWDVFGNLYGFGLLLAIAMDAFFAMSAAVSKTSDQAMQIAMPFLFLFVIYNGFLVTKETCPYYFKWILYTSPIAWVFEQIGIGTYEDHDNFDQLVEQYGWITSKGHKWACIGVLLGMFCLFKFGEMLGLKYLHAHQR